jgi:3-dehydroquinate synthase
MAFLFNASLIVTLVFYLGNIGYLKSFIRTKLYMSIQKINFSNDIVTYLIGESVESLQQFHAIDKTIILIDETVYNLHATKFEGYTVIQIKATEKNKIQASIDNIIEQMLVLNVDKSWMLVGVGGGVVTDMAGYAASIYKRGIKLGLIPTTILGMTDAAIGGKNGVNVGVYKNMVGTMHRPTFVLFDFSFLDSLPKAEWINGFAEIIKHACIKDAAMFEELAKHDIDFYIQNKQEIALLIEKNIAIKTDVVLKDEFEKADRYLLNFGHTFGHAIENTNNLPHGHAVSIGMVIAAKISKEVNNFSSTYIETLTNILQQYGLPVSLKINVKEAYDLLRKDKKVSGDAINFVLLNKIGEASVQKITFTKLESLIDQIIQ